MDNIWINTSLNDIARLSDTFGAFEPSVYTGSIEEAREEMAHWLEVGWATREETEENFEEVTPAAMQWMIKRFVLGIRDED